jgi:hypothetical protein
MPKPISTSSLTMENWEVAPSIMMVLKVSVMVRNSRTYFVLEMVAMMVFIQKMISLLGIVS